MEQEPEELGEDQALLILYLAGELPEEQRAGLERRLATEEALRKELEGLRAAQAMIWREMLAADSTQPLRGVASTAHRKLAGMVRQWAVHRLAREPAAPVKSRAIRWGIAVAAAATVALASVLYFNLATEQLNDVIAEVTDPPAVDLPIEDESADELFVRVQLTELEQELDELTQLRTLTQ